MRVDGDEAEVSPSKRGWSLDGPGESLGSSAGAERGAPACKKGLGPVTNTAVSHGTEGSQIHMHNGGLAQELRALLSILQVLKDSKSAQGPRIRPKPPRRHQLRKYAVWPSPGSLFLFTKRRNVGMGRLSDG